MKKIGAFIFSVFILSNGFTQGFTFNKEAYAERETVENTRGALPSSVSFKSYTPIIYPQESGNCVAQAFSNALNILIAKENNILDKAKISVLRPSPFFIYYTNKENNDYDCSMGLDAEKVALNLLKMGAPPMVGVEYPSYYPFTGSILCKYYPPIYDDDLKMASSMKPSSIYKIETLMDIKVALAMGMPVVVGMMVPNSFKECRSYVWSPSVLDDINKSYGHAMTIIGYNDNLYGGSFEIMNSWGETWGINGYTRISYKDASKWIMAGWAVEKDKPTDKYKYDGGLDQKDLSKATPQKDMISIFNEGLQDTVTVNPFFQSEDILKLFEEANE